MFTLVLLFQAKQTVDNIQNKEFAVYEIKDISNR